MIDAAERAFLFGFRVITLICALLTELAALVALLMLPVRTVAATDTA